MSWLSHAVHKVTRKVGHALGIPSSHDRPDDPIPPAPELENPENIDPDVGSEKIQEKKRHKGKKALKIKRDKLSGIGSGLNIPK